METWRQAMSFRGLYWNRHNLTSLSVTELNVSQQWGLTAPESPMYPGLHQKKLQLADWKRWFSTSIPILWDPTWNTMFSCRAPSTRKTWTCLNESRGGPGKWSQVWSTSHFMTGWESWGYLAWACSEEHSSLPVLNGGL